MCMVKHVLGGLVGKFNHCLNGFVLLTGIPEFGSRVISITC